MKELLTVLEEVEVEAEEEFVDELVDELEEEFSDYGDLFFEEDEKSQKQKWAARAARKAKKRFSF